MNRDPLEILEEMMDKLNCGRPFSINELSKATGIHNVTVKKYIRIVEIVNSRNFEIIKTGHSIIVRMGDRERYNRGGDYI